MAVLGRCKRRDCAFTFDDAENIENAVAKMAAHFRTEHHRKAFYESTYKEDLEIYNSTLDEAIENYLGPNWRNGEVRRIANTCAQICQYPDSYPPEIIEEARALGAQHGRAIPDPFDPANNPNVDGINAGFVAAPPQFDLDDQVGFDPFDV